MEKAAEGMHPPRRVQPSTVLLVLHACGTASWRAPISSLSPSQLLGPIPEKIVCLQPASASHVTVQN